MTRTRRIALAAFTLGYLVGDAEWSEVVETLREIAAGRLTLLGDELPDAVARAGERAPPEAQNDALRLERWAAKAILKAMEASTDE